MPEYVHKTGSELAAEEHLFGPAKLHPVRPDLVEVRDETNSAEVQNELRVNESHGVPVPKSAPPAEKEAVEGGGELSDEDAEQAEDGDGEHSVQSEVDGAVAGTPADRDR